MVTTPSQRVICLMESSVDGRIDESRWSVLYNEKGEGDPDVYYETQKKIRADVFVLGVNTVKRHHCSDEFTSSTHTKVENPEPFLGIRSHSKITAVFDSKGSVAYKTNNLGNTTLMVILGEDTCSQEYLDYLREREISYTFAGKDGNNIRKALNSLYSDFGLRKVLLSGGGKINGSFLKQGLIDELYLIIYPGVDGLSGVGSIFEYEGKPEDKPGKGQSLELISCEAVRAGVVRLRYKFHFYSC